MPNAHTSTADVPLPYDAEDSGHFANQAERLIRAKYHYKGEPLFGTTARAIKGALSRGASERSQPLFGNRLRWVARTFRDAGQHRSG